jgi:hypothetical protein
MGEPEGRLAEKPHCVGGLYSLYSDRHHQPQMFSPYTCNFFVPFAQKDAKFGKAANRKVGQPAKHAKRTAREMKA